MSEFRSASPGWGWVTKMALVLLITGLIAVFYLAGGTERFTWNWLRANVTDLQQSANTHLLLAIVVFVVIYVLVTSLSLPIAVWLTLLGGALFGRVLGTVIVSIAATLGATVAMLMSRFVLRDWVERRFGRRLELINRGLERDGVYYLLTLRLIPAMPYWLVNLGMGVTQIPTRTFALVTWVGMLPATILYVNAGTELGQIESPADVLSPRVIGALLLLACLPVAARFLIRRTD